MNAKEYLSTIRHLDIKIGQKLSEVDELHEIATSIGSFDYSKDRVTTSPSGEAPYTKTAERAAELDAQIRDLEDQKLFIIEQIRGLEDTRYVEVLYKRYVEYKHWEDIGEEMNYHWKYIYQLHADALEAFETSYPI